MRRLVLCLSGLRIDWFYRAIIVIIITLEILKTSLIISLDLIFRESIEEATVIISYCWCSGWRIVIAVLVV